MSGVAKMGDKLYLVSDLLGDLVLHEAEVLGVRPKTYLVKRCWLSGQKLTVDKDDPLLGLTPAEAVTRFTEWCEAEISKHRSCIESIRRQKIEAAKLLGGAS